MPKAARRTPLSKVRKHYLEQQGRDTKFREHPWHSPADSCKYFRIPTCSFGGLDRTLPKLPAHFFTGRGRDLPVHVDFTSGRTIHFVRFKAELCVFMGYGLYNELVFAQAKYLDLNV